MGSEPGGDMARLDTREQIIKVGGDLIATGGFGQTGIDKVLKKARVPKGSFYYYFSSKEDFGLAVIDQCENQMMERLNGFLQDKAHTPLDRMKNYFQSGVQAIGSNECRKGCLLGDLGQELAHQNEKFRLRLETTFSHWKAALAACLLEARQAGQISAKSDPGDLADFMLSGWEGAILRAKVAQTVEPMKLFVQTLFARVLVP
jgi:TetR/AcrR family transcriptional repressor of nem operon